MHDRAGHGQEMHRAVINPGSGSRGVYPLWEAIRWRLAGHGFTPKFERRARIYRSRVFQPRMARLYAAPGGIARRIASTRRSNASRSASVPNRLRVACSKVPS